METIINTLLQVYFNAKLCQVPVNGISSYDIFFTNNLDAETFRQENLWLRRFFYVYVHEDDSSVVRLDYRHDFESDIWLNVKHIDECETSTYLL
jgi:hypothetical protein